jgi:transcriptional regulator
MYVPSSYRAADPRDLIRTYPFATLVTIGPLGMLATLTPIFFASDAEDEMELIGHISAGNPQAETLEDGVEALALFTGPHAYISAGWYRERPTVPTWNYVSAQARGRIISANSEDEKIAILRRTALLLEDGTGSPWTLEQAPEGRVAELLPHIRAFRITLQDISGATKLSQAQPSSDRLRVIEALEFRGAASDVDVARLMRVNDGLA